jgi:hypothetical protein
MPRVLKVPHSPLRRQMPLILEHIHSAITTIQHHNIDEAFATNITVGLGGEDGGLDWGGGTVGEHLSGTWGVSVG